MEPPTVSADEARAAGRTSQPETLSAEMAYAALYYFATTAARTTASAGIAAAQWLKGLYAQAKEPRSVMQVLQRNRSTPYESFIYKPREEVIAAQYDDTLVPRQRAAVALVNAANALNRAVFELALRALALMDLYVQPMPTNVRKTRTAKVNRMAEECRFMEAYFRFVYLHHKKVAAEEAFDAVAQPYTTTARALVRTTSGLTQRTEGMFGILGLLGFESDRYRIINAEIAVFNAWAMDILGESENTCGGRSDLYRPIFGTISAAGIPQLANEEMAEGMHRSMMSQNMGYVAQRTLPNVREALLPLAGRTAMPQNVRGTYGAVSWAPEPVPAPNEPMLALPGPTVLSAAPPARLTNVYRRQALSGTKRARPAPVANSSNSNSNAAPAPKKARNQEGGRRRKTRKMRKSRK